MMRAFDFGGVHIDETITAGEVARLLQGLPLDRTPRPEAATLARWQAALPPGQARAVAALVGEGARTYRAAARAAGISPDTLKTHMRRIRRERPAVWEEIASLRARQRAARHAAAVQRAEERSRMWHRRQFYREYGYWPRERRRPVGRV